LDFYKKTYRLLPILVFLNTVVVLAQQDPVQSQYLFSQQPINPAYVGIHGYWDVAGLSRLQWLGIDGAPQTHSLYAHTGLFSKTKKYGTGFSISQDKIGVANTTFLHSDNAYHIKLDERTFLSTGLRLGIVSFREQQQQLSGNPADPNFQSNIRSNSFDVGGGLMLYTPDYFVGVSMPRFYDLNKVTTNQLTLEGNTGSSLPAFSRSYIFSGGYLFRVSQNIYLRPISLVRFGDGFPVRWDLNMNMLYDDLFWFGVSYKYNTSIGFNTQFFTQKGIRFGYAFDYSTTNIGTSLGATHELMVSYSFRLYKKPFRIKSIVHKLDCNPGIEVGEGDIGSNLDHQRKFRKGVKGNRGKSYTRYRF